MIFWLGFIGTSIGMACRSAKHNNGFFIPNDTFSDSPGEYNIWKLSSYFRIILALSQLSFGVAKFVDVIFDLVSNEGPTILQEEANTFSHRLLVEEDK